MTSFPTLQSANHDQALSVDGVAVSYQELQTQAEQLTKGLLQGEDDLAEKRIGFLMPASLSYVVSLLGVWRAGAIAVPLNVGSSIPEWEHALSSAGVADMVVDPGFMALHYSKEVQEKFLSLCERLEINVVSFNELIESGKSQGGELPDVKLTQAPQRRAMILFTSGTTSKPKGVVSTHGSIASQITTLVDAWCWHKDDVIPLFLPMHHVHGIINVLCCALWSGATVDLFTSFNADKVLQKVANGTYTVFMAVPTVYVKIMNHLEALTPEENKAICSGFEAMRLNVSGSAACPVPVFKRWQELTNQVLLERYGMTEIGMALSNPYEGERRAGFVGLPLPGVQVRLVEEDGAVVETEGVPGEIQVQSKNVFLEYWQNPKATEESFKAEWFCTGDVAVIENGYYRIMGRASIDIIKSGGYKISALEIEGTLLTHSKIAECAVIGVEDETWGEVVTAFVVLTNNEALAYEDFKSWCEEQMSAYKIPKKLNLVDSLPRNALGKVTKTALKP